MAAAKHGASGVVIASLTRAAAAEIAGRDTNVPDANVGTLHSHAFHALGRPAIVEASDGIKAWNEQVPTWRWKINAGSRINDPENAPLEAALAESDGDRLLSDMNVYRQRRTPRELWRTDVLRFARAWDDFKVHTNRLDFTDLIEKAIEDVDHHPVSPAVFLLDEAQDMSRLEMMLARKWGAHAQTFVIVGDPFQNLYQWRGSDPEAFSAGEVSGTKILDQSYRVPAAVQQYAVSWVKNIVKEGFFPEYKPRDEPGEVVVSPYTWQFPEPIIRAFEEDIERGYNVMVLASCSYMLNPMVATLRERGLPFHNPYRAVHGGWNPLRYADRVLAFMRPLGDVWGEDARLWSIADLELWTDVLAAKNTMTRGSKTIIEGRVAEIEAKPRFAREELEAPMKWDRTKVFFKEDQWDSITDVDLDWLRKNTRDSRKRVIDYPVAVAKRYGGKSLLERPKIIVGTIHSVKGGEADSVYVFPDLSRQGFDAWRRYGASRDAIYRQFYVAFTRAKTKLTLCSPHGSDTVTFPRP